MELKDFAKDENLKAGDSIGSLYSVGNPLDKTPCVCEFVLLNSLWGCPSIPRACLDESEPPSSKLLFFQFSGRFFSPQQGDHALSENFALRGQTAARVLLDLENARFHPW